SALSMNFARWSRLGLPAKQLPFSASPGVTRGGAKKSLCIRSRRTNSSPYALFNSHAVPRKAYFDQICPAFPNRSLVEDGPPASPCETEDRLGNWTRC